MCNGKGIRELIEWFFDEELIDTREEIQKFGITEKEIIEDGVERRVRAHFPPKVTLLAYRIFSFLRNNDSTVIVAGGMQHYVIALDKSKLQAISESYGLDFGTILPFVQLYEQKLLEKQNRKSEGE